MTQVERAVGLFQWTDGDCYMVTQPVAIALLTAALIIRGAVDDAKPKEAE